MKGVKTFIRKSMYGHTVCFTIGNQTFSLFESTGDSEEWTSKDDAKWLKKQLDNAFKNLETLITK